MAVIASQTSLILGPHITAVEDAKMDDLETQMSKAEVEVNQALQALRDGGAVGGQRALLDAQAELDAFFALKAQIIDLSRRNTNVRSLALSFGQKRLLTAACEDSLRALQKALLGRRDSPATR